MTRPGPERQTPSAALDHEERVGAEARWAGDPVTANPHPKGSAGARAWRRGWRQADEERR